MRPLTYLDAILHLRPGTQAAVVGGLTYGHIQWGTEAPIDKADLDAALAVVQDARDVIAARDTLKAARTAAVAAITVTTSTGKTFDGDETSQTRMARAIIGMQAASIGTISWTLANNQSVTVTVAELTEALILAGQQQAALWPIS